MENKEPLDQFGEAVEDLFESPDTYPDKVTYLALSEEKKAASHPETDPAGKDNQE